MKVASGTALESGTVSIGYSNRVEAAHVVPVIADLVARGALYHRNASGALSLAYVAAGRMLGYVEEHMNAWDCLAGQLMIEEAGGVIEDQDAGQMIREGGRVIAGTPDVFGDAARNRGGPLGQVMPSVITVAAAPGLLPRNTF